ncbi:MAG TPA: hypothetical protein VLA36_15915 [Longimicrobiales bacterium]|nr:hypothetical protein [Longimicrobiales bacterium]
MSRPNSCTRSVPAALFCLLAVLGHPLRAQEIYADSSFTVAAPSTAVALPTPQVASFKPPLGRSIVGGTLGSGVGLVGGAIVGYGLATCGSGEWLCGIGEAALGALVGSVVGSTVGANIGARGGGASPTFGSTVVGGLAGVLAGIAGGKVMESMAPDSPAPLLGFAVGQGLVTGLFAAKRR